MSALIVAMNTVVANFEGSILWVRLTEDAVHNYEASNVDQIVETFHSTLADEFRTRFETNDQFENRFEGVLIIQSLINPGKSWAWFNGSPRPLNELTFNQIEQGIAAIEQSDSSSGVDAIHRNKYGFLFTNPIRGAGKTKLPRYINRVYTETWQTHEYDGKPVNCAAFALMYQQTTSAKSRLKYVIREAFRLQTKMQWGEYVTSDELLKYVEHKKDCRLTLIIPSLTSYTRFTREGSEYRYAEVDGTFIQR